MHINRGTGRKPLKTQKTRKHSTKKLTVNAVLDEHVQRKKQRGILSLFGKVDYDGDYDYKRERRAR